MHLNVLVDEIAQYKMSNVHTRTLFNQQNLLEKNRHSFSIFTFVLIVWFVFTVLTCCTLFSFLYVKFSQDLTRDVHEDMRNFKRKIEDSVKTIMIEEIQMMRDELKMAEQRVKVSARLEPFPTYQFMKILAYIHFYFRIF